MFARGGQFEVVIEGDHFVNTRQRHIEFVCQFARHIARYITVVVLYIMQSHNQAAFFITPLVCQVSYHLILGFSRIIGFCQRFFSHTISLSERLLYVFFNK